MAKTVSVVGGISAGHLLPLDCGVSYDSHSCEVDLSATNKARLGKVLRPYAATGRRTTSQRRAAKTVPPWSMRVDQTAVHAWAAGHALQISERGRISVEG